MTFNLLTLQDFAASDTAYIDYMNTNNTSLTTMLTGARSDIVALNGNLGVFVAEDWYKAINAADLPGGILGPYSFVCVMSNPGTSTMSVSLTHGNADGNSHAYYAGSRYSTTATLSHTFTSADMSNNAAGTIHVGIDIDTVNLTTAIKVAASSSGMNLPLYSFYLTNAAGDFSVTKIKRFPRSLLMSNTLEQLRQETPESLSLPGPADQSTDPFVGAFVIPVDHVWSGFYAWSQIQTGGWYGTIDLTLESDDTLIARATILSLTGTNTIEAVIESDYDGVTLPAGTRYEMIGNRDGASTGVSQPMATVSYFRSYNVPTA